MRKHCATTLKKPISLKIPVWRVTSWKSGKSSINICPYYRQVTFLISSDRIQEYTIPLYPIPYTLYPIPYIPYTLYPIPYIPYTLYGKTKDTHTASTPPSTSYGDGSGEGKGNDSGQNFAYLVSALRGDEALKGEELGEFETGNYTNANPFIKMISGDIAIEDVQKVGFEGIVV